MLGRPRAETNQGSQKVGGCLYGDGWGGGWGLLWAGWVACAGVCAWFCAGEEVGRGRGRREYAARERSWSFDHCFIAKGGGAVRRLENSAAAGPSPGRQATDEASKGSDRRFGHSLR